MKRREFLVVLGSAAALWRASRAQQATKIPRIGAVWSNGNEREAVFLPALRQGFSELGYVEGRDFILENRFAAEQYDRFERLVAELIEARVDVLVTASLGAAFAAQRATTTIPIVFVSVGDPVGFKLVDSLARPGQNLTGLSNILIELSAKRLELFKEAVPGLSQVALLSNPRFQMTERFLNEHRVAARSLDLRVQEIEASDPEAIESAIASVARRTGLIIMGDPMLFNERKRTAELALAGGLPSMGFAAQMADAGLLMSYGPSFVAQYHRVALYVDRILKGAKPADLPVEQPAVFELVVNLATAKALGLIIPPALLARADRVTD